VPPATCGGSHPAKAIYDAFQAEATKRRVRPVEEWVAAERQAAGGWWLAPKLALVSSSD